MIVCLINQYSENIVILDLENLHVELQYTFVLLLPDHCFISFFSHLLSFLKGADIKHLVYRVRLYIYVTKEKYFIFRE